MKCIIDTCDKPSATKTKQGYCGMHAMRVRRYGDPHYVTSHEQFKANCREAALRYKQSRPDVYKKLFNRHEHRVIAEQMLGRPLLRGEIVHHKDGNKHNNSPGNLEVMTQSEHMKHHHAEMTEARIKKHGR